MTLDEIEASLAEARTQMANGLQRLSEAAEILKGISDAIPEARASVFSRDEVTAELQAVRESVSALEARFLVGGDSA